MRTPDGQGDSPDAEPRTPRAPAKKPYRAPRLVTYGSLPDLALAKGGPKADGPGAPRSKS